MLQSGFLIMYFPITKYFKTCFSLKLAGVEFLWLVTETVLRAWLKQLYFCRPLHSKLLKTYPNARVYLL